MAVRTDVLQVPDIVYELAVELLGPLPLGPLVVDLGGSVLLAGFAYYYKHGM